MSVRMLGVEAVIAAAVAGLGIWSVRLRRPVDSVDSAAFVVMGLVLFGLASLIAWELTGAIGFTDPTSMAAQMGLVVISLGAFLLRKSRRARSTR